MNRLLSRNTKPFWQKNDCHFSETNENIRKEQSILCVVSPIGIWQLVNIYPRRRIVKMEFESSELINLNEMNGCGKENSRSSLYFKDGVRKIDLVIAYESLPDDNKNEQRRKTFFEKIKDTGLETEEADHYNSRSETGNVLVNLLLFITITFCGISLLWPCESHFDFSGYYDYQIRKCEKMKYLLQAVIRTLTNIYDDHPDHPEVFCKEGVLRSFAKFIGKHLYHGLFFNKVAGRNF